MVSHTFSVGKVFLNKKITPSTRRRYQLEKSFFLSHRTRKKTVGDRANEQRATRKKDQKTSNTANTSQNNKNSLNKIIIFVKKNMKFLKKHLPHFIVLLVLLVAIMISGYLTFFAKSELITTIPTDLDSKEQISPTSTKKTEDIKIQKQTKPQIPSDNPEEKISEKSNESAESSGKNKTDISIEIQDTKYSSDFVTNTTLYELMQKLTASSIQPFLFNSIDYGSDIGHFVTEINGIKNNPKSGKYWIYYVNNEPATIGISNYIIHEGDKTEWKYEDTQI